MSQHLCETLQPEGDCYRCDLARVEDLGYEPYRPTRTTCRHGHVRYLRGDDRRCRACVAADMDSDGKALRALLPAHKRLLVAQDARTVNEGLMAALDGLDGLLEDDSADSLTMTERQYLKTARSSVLTAFAAIREGSPDLSGLIPAEALQ